MAPSFIKKLTANRTGDSVQSQRSTGTWSTTSSNSNTPSGLSRFASLSFRRNNNNNPFSDENSVPPAQVSTVSAFPAVPTSPNVPSPSVARGPVFGYSSPAQTASYQPPPQRDEKSASGPSGPPDVGNEAPPAYEEKVAPPQPTVASSSRSAPPEPEPRSLMRAGTFNATNGTFRNLGDLERMSKDQILDLFGAISGANILKEVDTIFVVDNSESMKTFGFWPLARTCLSILATIIAAFDPDGYSAYVLNRGSTEPSDYEHGIVGGGWNGLNTSSQIREIFDNIHATGSTPIDTVLEKILDYYLKRLEDKSRAPLRPLNIVVVTDGCADDPEGVEELIQSVCERLDDLGEPPNQIGIQFFQIGNIEMATRHIFSEYHNNQAKAAELIRNAQKEIQASTDWLQRIDDFMGKLATDIRFKKARDIVDTKNADLIMQEGGFNPVVLIRILCGALIKRFDNAPIVRR